MAVRGVAGEVTAVLRLRSLSSSVFWFGVVLLLGGGGGYGSIARCVVEIGDVFPARPVTLKVACTCGVYDGEDPVGPVLNSAEGVSWCRDCHCFGLSGV